MNFKWVLEIRKHCLSNNLIKKKVTWKLQCNSLKQFLHVYYSAFSLFTIAHELTSVPESLAMATDMTLQEFEEDGCCYIELRSTPRQTPHMTHRQYIETIVQTMRYVWTYPIVTKLVFLYISLIDIHMFLYY